MNLKPKIILYGAFDRYNYGDNLMPVLLETFLKNSYPELIDNYDLIFSSILKSDLSRYSCKMTTPIKTLLNVPKGSLIVIVGGETMGATIQGLYLYTFTNKIQHKLANLSARFLKPLFIPLSFLRYPSPWYYPYIPNKNSFSNNVNIILNTVGGIPSIKASKNLKKIDYISVRDLRSYEGMKKQYNVKLIPDSVLLLSKLYNIDALKSLCRESFLKKFDFHKNYIVVQMCPYKASCSSENLSKILMDLKKNGVEPILLPIGYASGHDDVIYLQEVQTFTNGQLKLFNDLNIWEIAYFIAMSKGFYGTSLHGVITAMAYKVQHFCINEKLEKLKSFMTTWSISPFSNPIKPEDIKNFINIEHDAEKLGKKIEYAQNLIVRHYHFIFTSWLGAKDYNAPNF